jgi:serine phosphatase RsbU (regulator of sigma subunit)
MLNFRHTARLLFLLILSLLSSVQVCAQPTGETPALTQESLRDGGTLDLDEARWRYHTGDDAAWASPQFDDSSWEVVRTSHLATETFPQSGWNGGGWFRLRLNVDPSLAGEPLTLMMSHWGASEVYVDGKLVYRFGVFGTTPDAEQAHNPRRFPSPIVFERGGEHVIAVRRSCMMMRDLNAGWGGWLSRQGFRAGFAASIGRPNAVTRQREWSMKTNVGISLLDVGICLAIALLHLLLFLFYPRQRANLFFSLFLFFTATNIALSVWRNNGDADLMTMAVLGFANIMTIAAAVFMFLPFLYTAFELRRPKYFWWFIALWSLLMLWRIIAPSPANEPVPGVTLASFFVFEAARSIVAALRKRIEGAWIVIAGVLLVALIPVKEIISDTIFDFPRTFDRTVEQIGIVGLIISLSTYLARNFARTNKDLEVKLEEVQQLSKEMLEQERTAAELKLQNEQERARRALMEQELSLAADIQKGLFPEKLPAIEGYEVAARNRPARLCGGDYYDVISGDETRNGDGSYLLCVADVAGKGLDASLLMSNMQATLRALSGHVQSLVELALQINERLYEASPSNKFVTAILLDINAATGVGKYVNAGHNPCLLLHGGKVELLESTGLPLGMLPQAEFAEATFQMRAGDMLALYSDGVPEAYNEREQEWGDDKLQQCLSAATGDSAEAIVNKVFTELDQFAGTAAQHDDITLLVVKRR